MGTNYYVQGKPHCGACGRGPDEGAHIGKASFGWAFLFAPNFDEGIFTAAAWWEYLKDKVILDECGDTITLTDLQAKIESRRNGWTGFTAPPEYYGNHDPAQYETLDPEGHRFSKSPDFS